MEHGQKVTVGVYDEKFHKTGEIEVSISDIARHLNEEQFAELLEDYGNKYFNEYHTGEKIGKILEGAHRTLQASIFRWALGLCVGLSERTITRSNGSTFEATDGRNEMSVACGKKIKELIESGELKMGYMI